MPEGDTVHKLAGYIAGELTEKLLTSCFVRGAQGAEKLAGSTVTKVEALGKHMLLHFDRELQLRVHLGMKGSWHHYKPGTRWKRPKSKATVVLETENSVLVCFNAIDVEFLTTPQRKWHGRLSKLGPDLLSAEEPDWKLILNRVAEFRKASDFLGEVLLDQRLAAGIGNVYKSELTFLGALEDDPFQPGCRGYCPWTPLSQIGEDKLIGIFHRARLLLQANLGGWRRCTRVDRRVSGAPKDGTLYVYERAKEACYRCGGVVAVDFQGLQNRITYWCPTCQGDCRPTAPSGLVN